MLLTLKSAIKKTAKYRPIVLITIRKRPRVKKVIGRVIILIIGFSKSSKTVKTALTLRSVIISFDKTKL